VLWVVYALAVLLPTAAGFVLYTALAGQVIEEPGVLLGFGLVCCLAVPILIRARVARGPSLFELAGALNLVAVTLICLGFADDVGRALRRHGDWLVGERGGWAAHGVRSGLAALAQHLERFQPPAELAALVLPPPVPTPLVAEPAPTLTPTWFVPLARRAMPGRSSRRFGATRPQPRPPECELGHCGVDLGDTFGEAVFAASDGVVERVELDAARGGRAGRYIRLSHADGQVVTRYVHLDSVEPEIVEGARVRGGQLLGRVGRTGVEHSGPHLHFSLSIRSGGSGSSERYIDPEPLLSSWNIPEADVARVAELNRGRT
jgi:hypothetical protein